MKGQFGLPGNLYHDAYMYIHTSINNAWVCACVHALTDGKSEVGLVFAVQTLSEVSV